MECGFLHSTPPATKMINLSTTVRRLGKQPMNGTGEFWLHLSRMADAYSGTGETPADRIACAVEQFERMPGAARCEVQETLKSMAAQLPELYAELAARAELQRCSEVSVSAGASRGN